MKGWQREFKGVIRHDMFGKLVPVLNMEQQSSVYDSGLSVVVSCCGCLKD